MTKQGFISELQKCLSRLDEGVRNEICGDISDHFIEGAERGLTEDEICRNLGQPSVIAEQFMEEYGTEITDAKPTEKMYGENKFETREPSRSNGPAQRNEIRREESSGSFFDRPMYEIDIDRQFEDVRDISVELKNSELAVVRDEQASFVTVTIRGRARHDRFEITCEHGRLKIFENAIRYPFDFLFSRNIKMETTLRVPSSFDGDLSANVSNGEINASGVSGKNLALKNSLKSIGVGGCAFRSFDLKSFVGNIDFTNCVGSEITLSTSAGNVKTEDTAGNLNAQCSAGEIKIKGHTGDVIKAKASAGKLTIEDSTAKIDAHSSADNVKILCRGKILRGVRAHSSAGNVHIEADETKGLDVTSSAGNVKIYIDTVDGDVNLHSSAGNVKMDSNDIKGNVTAHSSAGNVKLTLPDGINLRIEASASMGSVKQHIKGNADSPYKLKATASLGTIVINGK